MRRSLLLALPLAALLAAGAGASPGAGREGPPGVEGMCERHGITSEEGVRSVRAAWGRLLRAGVPEGEAAPFLEDLLAHRLDCAQAARVLDATARARREGLPYFVVLSKAREGMAKGASPVLVVEAVEAKVQSLSDSRDVLKSLRFRGYRVLDFQNASIVVSAYLEGGRTKEEIITEIDRKGILGAGFAALSDVVRRPTKREER